MSLLHKVVAYLSGLEHAWSMSSRRQVLLFLGICHWAATMTLLAQAHCVSCCMAAGAVCFTAKAAEG